MFLFLLFFDLAVKSLKYFLKALGAHWLLQLHALLLKSTRNNITNLQLRLRLVQKKIQRLVSELVFGLNSYLGLKLNLRS